MGTPRPHVSRHVSGRAPRRGRRPRRPVFRSPIAGCTRVLHVCLRRPYFFQQRKKYGKERRQKPTVFGFPFRPIVTAVQKGSAPDRLHSYPRCRSCVRRVRQRRLYRRPHVSRHVSGRAPRRGRRPRRPVFRSPIAGCARVLHLPPVAIFLSTAKEIWKRTPPKTDGFWISLSSNCNCGAKRFRTESPARLSPLPAPASRTKTFFSRAVQGKCFTSYILLYSAARRAAPALAAEGGKCAI